MKKLKIISLFLFIACALVLIGCNQDDVNDAIEGTNEQVKIVNLDSFHAVSVAEKYEKGEFSGESENPEDLSETDSKSIVDIVDENYSMNEDYDYIETDRTYSVSFDLSESISLTSNDLSKQIDRNVFVDAVKINGENVEFYFENRKLIIKWKTPEDASNEDITFKIECHKTSPSGVVYFEQVGKINSNINDKQYDVVIYNTKAYTDKFTMDIDVKKNNNGKGGSLYFLLSDGDSIIKEIQLVDGLNSLELDDLDKGHSYEYMVINKANKNIINSYILYGEFISLLPYQITFEEITSNSVSIFLLPKGTKGISNIDVYVYDSGNIVGGSLDRDNSSYRIWKFKNLVPNHEYEARIGYYNKKKDKREYFSKKFRTLATDEELVGMMPNVTTELSSWPNGTKVEIKPALFKDSHIYLKKGSITCDNDGNIVKEGCYVKLTLPYDSFVKATITSSNNSVVYTRTAYITNGTDYYRLKVSSYISEKIAQSYFLKKGEYYIYTEDQGIFIYNLTIDAIMKQPIDSSIYDENNVTYSVQKKDENQMDVFIIGKEYDFSNYAVKKIYHNENGNYYKNVDDFKVCLVDLYSQVLDFDENTNSVTEYYTKSVIVSPNDTVLESHKQYNIIKSIIIDNKPIDLFKYGDDIEKHNFGIFDENNVDYFTESSIPLTFFVNEEVDYSGYCVRLIVQPKGESKQYVYRYAYLDALDGHWGVSFWNDLGDSGDIFELDTSREVNNGGIGVSYNGDGIDVAYQDKYRVVNLSIDEPTIYSDKTVFVDKIDDLSNYASIKVNGGNDISYKKLEEFAKKNVGGVSDVRLAYYMTDPNVLYDTSDLMPGTYNAVLLMNGEIVTDPIEITIKQATVIARYDGVAAKADNYDVWDITGDYLKVAANPEEGGEATAGVQMRAFTYEATITSKEFAPSTMASIVTMVGTNSSAKEAYLLLEFLDVNGNPVEILENNGAGDPICFDEDPRHLAIRALVSNNKITTKTVFEITTKSEFVKIRISRILCGSNKKVAIVSIDAAVA